MEKLFKKVHETQSIIDNAINEIVEMVALDINDKEFTLDELNAMVSMIQSKMNSQLSYKLLTEVVWKARDL